jgi:phage tail-like protein
MRASTTRAWRRAWLTAVAIGILTTSGVQAQAVRKDPLRRFLFRVEIDGLNAGFFKSVSGLSIETEVIEFREGGSDVIHKLPGARKYPNLVLKQGFTGDTALYEWFNSFRGKPARVDGTIIMLGADLSEVARWEFHNGFPVKWEGPDFDASSNDVPIETIEIAHEGLTLVKP